MNSVSRSSGSQKSRIIVPVLLLLAILFCALLPIVSLVWISLISTADVWPHLINYVLPNALFDTLLLLLLVGLGTGIIGVAAAWVTTVCNFPGRTIFTWAMVLPLAVPTYIAAYAHVEFFDFSGPLQSYLRHWLGYTNARDYWFPDIRSVWGAGFVLSSVLYPYVFLTCRLVFSSHGASLLDASRSLGASPHRVFREIGLPMVLPALAAGGALALMETLNDIGAVEILGVKTLTFAVFETWLNRGSLAGASQLALLTLIIVAGLIWVERYARRKRDYASSTRERPPARLQLTPFKQALCLLLCLVPLVAGLLIPIYVLAGFALPRLDQLANSGLMEATQNSLLIAILSATFAVTITYLVLQYGRLSKRPYVSTIGRIASLGYAVPGTVLAIGLLIPIATFDNWLDGLFRDWFNISTGLLISGSIALLVYACTLRFLAIAFGTMETGFQKISPNIDLATRALGRSSGELGWQIHRPMMAKTMAIAFFFVFVDTMKELSATLLLRPFNFETLATFVYDRASQAAIEEAASGSLLIIAVGLISIAVLNRLTNQTD